MGILRLSGADTEVHIFVMLTFIFPVFYWIIETSKEIDNLPLSIYSWTIKLFGCSVSPFPTSLVTTFFAVSVLKHPRTPSNTLGMMDYQNADHDHLMKRLRSAPSVDEVLTQCCGMFFFFSIAMLFLQWQLTICAGHLSCSPPTSLLVTWWPS